MSFPLTVDEITAEWLTAALRRNGAIGDASVESFELTNIGAGKGIFGEVHRVDLSFGRGEGPSSIIAKVAARDEEIRKVTVGGGMYEREVKFYTDLAPSSDIRVPAVYFAEHDGESGDFMLLLEDLSGLRAVDKMDDLSLADALTIMEYLARLHAQWWEDERLSGFPWLGPGDAGTQLQQQYSEVLERFLEIGGPFLPDGIPELARKLESNPLDMEMFVRTPTTLTHTDFKLGNMFFDDSKSGADSVVVFDWQTVSRMRGSIDTITFVTGYGPDNRRKFEKKILSAYHDVLVDQGIANFSYDDLISDFRFGVLVSLYATARSVVLAAKPDDPRIKPACEKLQALIDWDCEELIP